jgi:type II secretory pathway pseudopilin PulG
MSSSPVTPDVSSSHPTRGLRRRARGFSLLELAIVVCITMTATGVVFISLQPALKSVRATNAFNLTLATLRRAHDQAVSQKGVLLVTFTSPGTLTVTQPSTLVCEATALPGTWFNSLTTTLPSDMGFTADANLPTAAPDGFGSGKVAIDFDQGVASGTPTAIYFCPDGSARDVNNNINNGVVYMERTGDLYSSRALTVWGVTGRIKGWRLDKLPSGSATYWRQQ